MTHIDAIEVVTHFYAGKIVRRAVAIYMGAVVFPERVHVEVEEGESAPSFDNGLESHICATVGHAWIERHLPDLLVDAEVRLAEYVLRNGHK